jgi:methionine biosynthesis protein MetW
VDVDVDAGYEWAHVRARDQDGMKRSRFFDDQHGTELLPLPLHFRLLRRFEVERLEVATRLCPAQGRVLDIGCGDGEFAAALARRGQPIVATDISPVALAEAARQHGSGVRWLVVDASRALPFADSSFDVFVSLSTLQYVFDPTQLLSEAARVLRPNGTLLIEVPNMAYLPQRLRLLIGRPIKTSYWPHGIDGGNLHYFTVELLAGLITRAGFRVVTVTGSGVLAPVRTFWVSLLCGNMFVLATRV